MNRKKFLALLLAGGMLAQTAMSVAMPLFFSIMGKGIEGKKRERKK